VFLTSALIAVSAPASALVVTTQNVYRGLGPINARHDIRQAAAGGSVVFAQEMSGRRAGRFAPAGWRAAQAPRPRLNNRGDCATFYDAGVWRLRRSYVVPLLAADTHYRPNGHRWALVAVLTGAEALAAVCVHLPTHGVPRRLYWLSVARLRPVLQRLAGRFPHVVVGGDWNNPFPTRARFRGFVCVRVPRATGPKGGRPDYVYVRRPDRITGGRVIGGTYSDHNGMRVRIGGGG